MTTTTQPAGPPLLRVDGLEVSIDLPTGTAKAVDGVSFDLPAGEILGIVGESGSGKSLTALAISRMLPSVARITGGSVGFDGTDITCASEKQMQRIRGRRIGMVFQDPLASLNPQMTVGTQISEVLRLHGATRAKASARTVELLRLVGIRNPLKAVEDYPHQFSGGMRQRVMIAMAVANRPDLVIADEPTTALDVTIQAEVLRLLARLRDEMGTAIMLITHDMGIVEELCDEVVVLYGGRIAEKGQAATLLGAPRHPYTNRLMQAVPRLALPLTERLATIPGYPPELGRRTVGCRFAPRCELAEDVCRREQPRLLAAPDDPSRRAACWVVNEGGRRAEPPQPTGPRRGEARGAPSADTEPIIRLRDVVVDFRPNRLRRRGVGSPAVNGVSLDITAGRALGLVGESGCGKTTLSQAIVGLVPTAAGELGVAGRGWATASRSEQSRMRRTVQMVFQDPYASLNPRWRVRDIVTEPLRNFPERPARDAAELLELVGLTPGFLDRYPHELSGGQRQRVGIARALAVEPEVIVADEPVSALDVSVQAQVINLLGDLRDRLGIGFVFVAHDLAVVRHISDELAVMFAGRIVEHGPAREVFSAPQHPYTSVLMASAPGADALVRGAIQQIDSEPADPHRGCPFRSRCPVGPQNNPDRGICVEESPTLRQTATGHLAACHFAGDVLPMAKARSDVGGDAGLTSDRR